jgi:hypothetical protein
VGPPLASAVGRLRRHPLPCDLGGWGPCPRPLPRVVAAPPRPGPAVQLCSCQWEVSWRGSGRSRPGSNRPRCGYGVCWHGNSGSGGGASAWAQWRRHLNRPARRRLPVPTAGDCPSRPPSFLVVVAILLNSRQHQGHGHHPLCEWCWHWCGTGRVAVLD